MVPFPMKRVNGALIVRVLPAGSFNRTCIECMPAAARALRSCRIHFGSTRILCITKIQDEPPLHGMVLKLNTGGHPARETATHRSKINTVSLKDLAVGERAEARSAHGDSRLRRHHNVLNTCGPWSVRVRLEVDLDSINGYVLVHELGHEVEVSVILNYLLRECLECHGA